MDPKFIEARDYVIKARDALRRGDKASARQMGEQVAMLLPEMEDAWLILAASDPNPEDALAYARKALELKPDSSRARRAVEWAQDRLKQTPASSEPLRVGGETAPTSPLMKPTVQKIHAPVKAKPNKRIWIYGGVLGLLACVVLGVVAWSAVSSPVFASVINIEPAPTQEKLWAQVEVSKPEVTPIDASAFAPQVTDTPIPTIESSPVPTDMPTSIPTDVPTSVPTEAPTIIPEATETPGVLSMEIVDDTPTSESVPLTTSSAPKPSVASNGKGTHWIDVDLTNQMVYAYEGETVVNSFLVSTGTWLTPTVTGQYKVYVKYRYADMSGPGYYLPDVPYVMYFYKGYGLHGTYWHHNFGTPMSHGCVNLSTSDAEWLFNWSSVGTVVNVHY